MTGAEDPPRVVRQLAGLAGAKLRVREVTDATGETVSRSLCHVFPAERGALRESTERASLIRLGLAVSALGTETGKTCVGQ